METTKKISLSIDPFWFNSPEIIFNKDRLTEFFPVESMTNNEKLNAILRLSIYISLLLMIYHKKMNFILIGLFVGLVTLYVFKYNNVQEIEEKKEGFAIVDCQEPSEHNPFANTLVTDVGVYKEKKEACLIEDVEKKLSKEFNKGLYKDVNDLYEKNNSQNRFYTAPNTNEYGIKHGDTIKFANWLWNTGSSTCKEDTGACTNSFGFYNNELRNQPHLLVEKQ